MFVYVPRSHLGGGREFWFVSVCNSCLAQTLTQTTITSFSLIKMELPSWDISGNFGGTCHTKYQPTEWILHRVRLWYSTNSAIYIGRVLSQFQARWRHGWYIAKCRWFPQKEQKNLVPHTRGPVLGQDASGYASNKCQPWTCLQCTDKGEVLSPYNHVEQPPQSSYNMHSS